MLYFINTFNSEFLYLGVWFTDQNFSPLEIENKIKITLVINESVKYCKIRVIHPPRIFHHLPNPNPPPPPQI